MKPTIKEYADKIIHDTHAVDKIVLDGKNSTEANVHRMVAVMFLNEFCPDKLDEIIKDEAEHDKEEYEKHEHNNSYKMLKHYDEYKKHQTKYVKEKLEKLSYDMSEKSMHDALDNTINDVEHFITDMMSCSVCETERSKIKNMLMRLAKAYKLY